MDGELSASPPVRRGATPLPQALALAPLLRRIAGLALALEAADPAVAALIGRLTAAEDALRDLVPADIAPRMAAGDGGASEAGGRVYLDHSHDIGAFNPCFPEYHFDRIDGETASGHVVFPLVYEGPPGLVHGGFLAVFFDCVMQHQNCVTGLSGKTRSLQVTFRRSTPVLTELRFDISRSEVERGIASTARLLLDDEVLSIGEATTMALPPQKLTGHRFGKRRAETS